MRISSKQKKAFIDAVTSFVLPNENVELRLFGSRLDDNLQGGDIDLLLICHSEKAWQYLAEHKPSILAKLYIALDEEKIDLLITSKNKINDDIFVKSAYDASQMIHSWH